MSEYNNLLDIFDRIVEVSWQLHDEGSFDAEGFDKCIDVLKYGLKQYVPINLHVENRKLQRQLADYENVLLKLKECNCAKNDLQKQNKDLRSENHVLTVRLNSLKSEYERLKKQSVNFSYPQNRLQ